jgi:hypothetical protein
MTNTEITIGTKIIVVLDTLIRYGLVTTGTDRIEIKES